MEFDGKNLEQYFIDLEQLGDFSKFPHSENYPSHYKFISGKLYKWVHSEVDSGALLSESELDSGVILTKHGTPHIKAVVGRATKLLDHQSVHLDPFEVFLLLMAIHFHDIANMLGRDGHAVKSNIFIEKMGTGIVGEDKWIWDYVYEISKAHGGYVIEHLPQEDFLHDIRFRPQLLAAILKFADEISENFERANNQLLELGKIHGESELHHKYSSCFNSVVLKPNSRELLLIYNLEEDDLRLKFNKNGEEVFLLDELYLRTLKTYSEKVYCSRFFRPQINIDVIKVKIKIKRKKVMNNELGYEIRENIVDASMSELFRLCPEMEGQTGADWYEILNPQGNGE